MNVWPCVQITLQHVFESATGITFMWDDEPRKMCRKPFGVLALGQCVTVGRDYGRYTFHNSDTSLNLIGHRELTISVQVFGRGRRGELCSRWLIEKARLSLANPMCRDELRSAGLIFVENHPVSHMSFSHQHRTENRASFDVVFRLVLQNQLSAKINHFESIELESRL